MKKYEFREIDFFGTIFANYCFEQVILVDLCFCEAMDLVNCNNSIIFTHC